MKLKQIIGIPLLVIFLLVTGNRLVDNLSKTGGKPMILLAVLIILFLFVLVLKKLRDY